MKYALKKTIKCGLPTCQTITQTGSIIKSEGPFTDLNYAYRHAEQLNNSFKDCNCCCEVVEIDQ